MVQKEEFELHPEHLESTKVKAARELKLYRTGQDVEEMYAIRLQSIQQLVQQLDHIMEAEEAGSKALATSDISIVYNAISPSVRKLVDSALEHQSICQEHSRITHEISDTVTTLVPEKVKDVKPLLSQAN